MITQIITPDNREVYRGINAIITFVLTCSWLYLAIIVFNLRRSQVNAPIKVLNAILGEYTSWKIYGYILLSVSFAILTYRNITVFSFYVTWLANTFQIAAVICFIKAKRAFTKATTPDAY